MYVYLAISDLGVWHLEISDPNVRFPGHLCLNISDIPMEFTRAFRTQKLKYLDITHLYISETDVSALAISLTDVSHRDISDLDVLDIDMFLHLDISDPNAKEFPYISHLDISDPDRSNLDVLHSYISQLAS